MAEAKANDPMRPVTVVAPSGYGAVFARRALAQGEGDAAGCVNVSCTTLEGLVEMIGTPTLDARGQRLAPAAVDREIIRAEAPRAGGALGRLAPNAPTLGALSRSLAELRRCAPPALEALGRSGRGRDVLALLRSVRARLHELGYADTLDLRVAAVEAARTPAPAIGSVVCWDLDSPDPLQRRVLDTLGATAAPRPSAPPSAVRCTEVCECRDPDEEGRAALRRVLSHAEDGVPLWRQAVFHPAGSTYARVLGRQLADAGVPATAPGATRLDRCAAGRALIGLLELADGDWGRDEVMAWVAGSPITNGPDGGLVPATAWDSASAAAGVVRGVAQWRDRLERRAGHPDAEGRAAAALWRFVEELHRRCAPPAASWRAFAAWAVDLLEHYVSPEEAEAGWPVDQVKAAAQVRGAVRALGALDALERTVDLAAFRAALRCELEATELDGGDGGGALDGGVFVAPLELSPGLRFDTVVVCGLADAQVPGHLADDQLLPDELRRLDPSGGLRPRAVRTEALARCVRGALAAGAVERIATYPATDPRTGREHVPSRWLTDLVAPGTRRVRIESFVAGLVSARPALSIGELRLRDLSRVAASGDDPVAAARALGPDGRLECGLGAATARAGSRFTRFDGHVGACRVSPFDPDTAVSATRLEAYAECPRRFLLDRVLHVSQRTRPEDRWQIEATERGTVVHAVLEQYVVERLAGTPRSLGRLLQIAEEHFADAEARGVVGRALLWRVQTAALRRDLRRFYEEEGNLEPLAAELAFGDDEPASQPAVAMELADGRVVRFQGKADRVDRTRGGRLVVSDYKTGAQRSLSALTRDPLVAGRRLQLPLYGMAARERFGSRGPVHARYWLLSGERSAACYHLELSDAVESYFRSVVELVTEGIEAGVFPAVPGAPRNGTFEHCAYCDFDRLCPAGRERQWASKRSQPELRSVTRLIDAEVPSDVVGAVAKGFVDPDAP